MKKIWMALVLVAGCGAGKEKAEDAPAGKSTGKAIQVAGPAGLTGLYEGGGSTRPNQMCVIDKGEGSAQFGLVVWGGNMNSCAGSGTVAQKGDKLTLTMAGDQSCTIEASVQGGNVTLPDTLPSGCSYYCGAQAKMGGASFAKKGGTAEDAMKAKDLVGESLCTGG